MYASILMKVSTSKSKRVSMWEAKCVIHSKTMLCGLEIFEMGNPSAKSTTIM